MRVQFGDIVFPRIETDEFREKNNTWKRVLLKEAAQKLHSYYHLVEGTDALWLYNTQYDQCVITGLDAQELRNIQKEDPKLIEIEQNIQNRKQQIEKLEQQIGSLEKEQEKRQGTVVRDYIAKHPNAIRFVPYDDKKIRKAMHERFDDNTSKSETPQRVDKPKQKNWFQKWKFF